MNTLQHTYALILGGSSGLGLATAHKLAASGYHIILVHRTRKSELAPLLVAIDKMKSHGVEVHSFNKDALKQEVISAIINEIKNTSISVIIHSIAKGSLQPLTDAEKVLGHEDIAITLHAMGTSWWQWTNALLQSNKFTDDVRNIAFTSEGNSTVWKGYGAVSAAKATLEALMRQMAVALASKGIKTNCIQAGATQTPSFNMIPGSEKIAAMALKRNPMQRMTTPEDVANAVYILCTPEAAWINGTILKVDGGESLQ